MTSLRHVLFPEHLRTSRPALFPPISLILVRSSRHTRKQISAQKRFNQSSCVKDRRLVRLYVLLCDRENIMHQHLSSLVRLNSKTCRFTLSTWPGSEAHQAWCDAMWSWPRWAEVWTTHSRVCRPLVLIAANSSPRYAFQPGHAAIWLDPHVGVSHVLWFFVDSLRLSWIVVASTLHRSRSKIAG